MCIYYITCERTFSLQKDSTWWTIQFSKINYTYQQLINLQRWTNQRLCWLCVKGREVCVVIWTGWILGYPLAPHILVITNNQSVETKCSRASQLLTVNGCCHVIAWEVRTMSILFFCGHSFRCSSEHISSSALAWNYSALARWLSRNAGTLRRRQNMSW